MNEICSIIVLYNPAPSVFDNILACAEQSHRVVLVDNGSRPEAIESLRRKLNNIHNLSWIINGDNLGIASALNIGVKMAKLESYKWVATFDQDSKIPRGFMEKMLEAYYIFPENSKVRIISPLYRDDTTRKIISAADNRIYDTNNSELSIRNIKTTITSGNIISTDLFDEIGYFDDQLFIDMVDHDFCLRCVSNGLEIIETNSAILNHNLGEPKQFQVFGRKITSTNHSSVRRYYMMRNRIYLYKKHHSHLDWILTDASIFFTRDIPKIVLFEDDKLEKLVAIFKGMVDGCTGKLGRKND